MKKENEKDPKNWTFELDLNKQISRGISRVSILAIFVWISLVMLGEGWLAKYLGSVEKARKIIFMVECAILVFVLFIGWIVYKKIRKKYWPIIVVPILALLLVILIIKNYPDGEKILRNDILSFAGDYLSFLGTFCLGYFIYLQDEAKRIDDKRSKVQLLLEIIESADMDLLRLRNIVYSSKREVLLNTVTYDENWRMYYHEYEALKGDNFDLKQTLNLYFLKIEQINNALNKGEYEVAYELYKSYVEKENYSIRKYNSFEAKLCLQNACTDFNFVKCKSWIEDKKTIKLINELCGKYYYIIENYIYVWLLRKNITTTSEHEELDKEITDWLINNSPEIKEVAKFPSDKRIINKVVHDCSIMMNSKSEKIQYVWGEYSLRK